MSGIGLAAYVLLALGQGPAPTPRPYWEWVSGTALVWAGTGWTVDVLHGGGVTVIGTSGRVTLELSGEQRRELAALANALPRERRDYRLGIPVLDGPEFHLRLDDGERKVHYMVLGAEPREGEAEAMEAIARVAVFLRGLVRETARRVRISTVRGTDYKELVAVECVEETVLRYLDDMAKPPGTHTHEIVIRKEACCVWLRSLTLNGRRT